VPTNSLSPGFRKLVDDGQHRVHGLGRVAAAVVEAAARVVHDVHLAVPIERLGHHVGVRVEREVGHDEEQQQRRRDRGREQSHAASARGVAGAQQLRDRDR